MRLRSRLLFLLASALGAAMVVLPAVAGSETGPMTVTAINSEGFYKEQRHYWSPAAVTVTAGGGVTFSNPSTEVSHGLEWTGGPAAPSCSGLPSGGLGATAWHAECTFAQSGAYTFRCTVHPSEMTGAVTVAPNGTTTTTMTTAPQPGLSGGLPVAVGPTSSPQPVASLSPLAGPASQALRIAHSQRGRAVRGSVRVSPAGSGGRLEVDLLARGASLASATHGRQVRVGRLVRSALPAGSLSFKVALSARGRRTLRLRGRLALNTRIVLRAPGGASVVVNRGVVLHA